MDTDRVTGTAKEMFGKAERAVGDIAGDGKTSASGAARQAEGIAENVLGQAKDSVRNFAGQAGEVVADSVQENPGSSLLMAGFIGLALGYVLAKGSQPSRSRWDRYR